MRTTYKKINDWLNNYLHLDGDNKEVLLLKKIWWMCNILGLPFLLVMSALLWTREGLLVFVINCIFSLFLIASLLIFHFYKKKIELFALATQLCILVLTALKVYLLGGLLNAGGAIFIGLIAPLYALTLPNNKRAVLIFVLYMLSMYTATLLQNGLKLDYFMFYYFVGFFVGNTTAFTGLYYYTSTVERLKRRERNRLIELDKLKTRFYTNITHEFRTPLTIILGMAKRIRENFSQNLAEDSEMIARNGQHLLDLTNKMLKLSKLKANIVSVDLTQIDVIAYLKYLIESFHSLAEEKEIGIRFNTDFKSIMMDVDMDKLKDIVSNLITNAIKFSHIKGEIFIKVAKEQRRTESMLVLSVKDEGIGIANENISKIFDQYYQENEHNSKSNIGTGLGLAITKELIELLNGRITVTSKLNSGSTFKVFLPVRNNAVQKSFEIKEQVNKLKFKLADNSISIKETKNDKLSVLLVEDNTDVIKFISSLLEFEYQLYTATNGQLGFEKACEIIPDLIISDIMMPIMDGFELCNKLKHDIRTSHIPLVLLTAKADESSIIEGFKVGADAYLLKPFNPEELEIRIEKLIEIRKVLQEKYKTENLVSLLTDKNENDLSPNDIFFEKVNNVLQKHISDDEFGILELCKSLGMSRSQLYRKFAVLTNSTVHGYIKKLRLLKAKSLLLTTDLNVSEIAYETGFKNLSHFSRVYSSEFGMSPSRVKTN